MDYLLKALLASKDCSDLYELLSDDGTLINVAEVCRSVDCRSAIEFFLQRGGENLAGVANSYLKIAPLALIISTTLGGQYVGRFAHRFSKLYVNHYLTSFSETEFLEVVRGLGLYVEKSSECFNEIDLYVSKNNTTARICYRYRIPFTSYLNAVKTLSSTEFAWSLFATALHRGYILIESREKIERIFLEHLRNFIISKIKSLHTSCSNPGQLYLNYISRLSYIDQNIASSVENLIQNFSSTTNMIGKVAAANSGSVEGFNSVAPSKIFNDTENLLVFAENFFPPCMQSILRSLVSGDNLTHHQRFALATFLLNLDIDIDNLLSIFRYSPDFNERIARYQLEHLAGLRGSKKRYLPYSCATMKTLNLCSSDCGTKNPLQYFYRRSKSSVKDFGSTGG